MPSSVGDRIKFKKGRKPSAPRNQRKPKPKNSSSVSAWTASRVARSWGSDDFDLPESRPVSRRKPVDCDMPMSADWLSAQAGPMFMSDGEDIGSSLAGVQQKLVQIEETLKRALRAPLSMVRVRRALKA